MRDPLRKVSLALAILLSGDAAGGVTAGSAVGTAGLMATGAFVTSSDQAEARTRKASAKAPRSRRAAGTRQSRGSRAGAAETADANETIAEFRNGTDGRSVGIIPAGEETEASGPAALTVGDDGTLYVLDQNNGRVLAMDGERSGASPEILDLPGDGTADDLAVVHDRLFLWDEGLVPLEQTPAADGQERALRAATDTQTDDYALSVFSSMGSQPPGPLNEIVEGIGRSLERPADRPTVQQYVPSRGLGDVVAAVSVVGDRDIHITLRRRGEENDFLALQAQSADRVGTVELLDIDTTGRSYAMIETVAAEQEGNTGIAIVRFGPDGRAEHVYDVPLDPDTVFSRRFVAIGPRGDVLFLATDAGRSQVVRLGGRTVPGDGKIRVAGPPPRGHRRVAATSRHQPHTALLARSRDEVIERAVAFETANWRVTPQAYGTDPASGCQDMRRLRRPTYLVGKEGQVVKGVPYCWGCRTPLATFLGQLGSGQLAGNVCTRSDPQPGMIGVDCSSFVDEVWGLKDRVTTAAMSTVAQRLPDPWSLMPGDALNKPGSHIMLFMRFTPDRRVEVMEASPNACKGRVCRNTYSLGSLLARGFQPIRFGALRT